MPIHLTCDFCDATSDTIGHWRFEGKTDIDVVICPACYAAHSTAEGTWDAWDAARIVATSEIRNRHYAVANRAIEADTAAWDAAHPEPPPVDWDALLRAKRGALCVADADDTCEVPAVDPASWQEVRYWYATCTRCFGDCEGM